MEIILYVIIFLIGLAVLYIENMYAAIIIFIVSVLLLYYNRDKLYLFFLLRMASGKGDQSITKAVDKILEYEPLNVKKKKYFVKRLNLIEKKLSTYCKIRKISSGCYTDIKKKIIIKKVDL